MCVTKPCDLASVLEELYVIHQTIEQLLRRLEIHDPTFELVLLEYDSILAEWNEMHSKRIQIIEKLGLVPVTKDEFDEHIRNLAHLSELNHQRSVLLEHIGTILAQPRLIALQQQLDRVVSENQNLQTMVTQMSKNANSYSIAKELEIEELRKRLHQTTC